MKPIDISPEDLKTVRAILRRYLPEIEVRAFGSRVRWTARGSSDLDLVLMTKDAIDAGSMADLREAFVESDLPFKVDLVDWATASDEFRRRIEEECEVVQEAKVKDMSGEWATVKFGDVLSGGTRNGIYKKKEFHGSGVKIVNMGELFAHSRLRAIPMKRVELTVKEIDKLSLRPGDLLFARRSLVAEGAGKCSIVLEVDERTTFEFSIIRGRPDPDKVDSLFLYYLFNSPHGRYLLGTIRRQVAVAGITGSDLVQLEIPLPPLDQQRAIAHILGSLDDKIELNRRMNETLEAMARAIFKSWFVDFDQVYENIKRKGAKAQRRKEKEDRLSASLRHGVPALNQEILDLFPDSFQDSDLGEIPKGWEIKTIGEAVRCVGGSTPSTKNVAFWNGGTNPFVTPKDMSSLTSPIILDTARHITDAGVDKISSGRLPAGTVLLSSMAPIGYLAITEVPLSVNQGIIAMICDKALPNYHVLYWTEANMDTIKSNAGGTTFAKISKRNFRPIQVIVPHERGLEAYVQQIEPLHRRMVSNLQETNTLSSLRDTLLPKLISGELRVPDVEKFIEETGV